MSGIAYTRIGYAYYSLPQDIQQDDDVNVALAISESSDFPVDDRTTLYTLGSVDGQRFGRKVKRRYWFTKVQSFQDIEDGGGKFVAIVHAGYSEQPHSLVRDLLVGSHQAGPNPKFDEEDDEVRKPRIWDTKKWAGVALCHLVQRETFVPCNGIENSIPSILQHLKSETNYVLKNWDNLMADTSLSVFQIGCHVEGVDGYECEVEEMVL